MIEEVHDRMHQSGRASLNDAISAGLHNLRDGVSRTFAAIHQIQFESPWKKRNTQTVRA